jgi:hypothetical protein
MTRIIATTLAAGLLGAGLLVIAAPSHAVPAAPFETQSNVVLVAGGCGEGWHRGPFGGCRRNWADPDAHACPRGYHIGPGGRCRGNGK